MTPQSDQNMQHSASGDAQQRKRPVWRRIRWWLLGVLLLLSFGGAAAIHYLPALARPVVQSVAADLGLSGLDLRFDEIGWRGAVLRDVTVGQEMGAEPDLYISRIDLTYTLSDLIAGRVGTLRLLETRINGSLDESGLDLGALSPFVDRLRSDDESSAAAGAPSIPFDRLDLEAATVLLMTPEGEVDVSLVGALDTSGGVSDFSAAFEVRLAGDLARGSGEVEVDINQNKRVVRFSDLDVTSDHVLLPGAVSLTQADGEVHLDTDGGVNASLKGELAIVADPVRPLPIKTAQMPLDMQVRFDPARRQGELTVAGCVSLTVEPGDDASWIVEDITLCPDDTHPLVRVDFTDGLTAVEADFSVMPVQATLGSLLTGVSPRMEVDVRPSADNQLIIKSAFSGGDFLLPGQSVHVAGLEGSATLLPEGAGQLGRIDLERVIVTDTQDATRFAPVVVTADLSLDGLGEDGIQAGRIEGPVEVKTPSGLSLVQGTLRHKLDSGDGRLDFSTGVLSFTEGRLQPQELAPILLGIVAAVSGEAGVTGRLEWDRDGLSSSSAKATLSGIGMQASAARFGSISGEIEFSSLVPVRTRGTQAVSIGVVDAGLPLEGGIALVRVEGGGDVIIENAQWPFAGGQLVLTSGALNTRADVQTAELAALSVNIRELLNLVKMDGLTGDGVLGGAVPIEIRDGSVYVMSAKLAAEPGGVIRYSTASTDAAGQTAEGANIAFQALENFHFDVLSVEIDGPVDGELTLKVVLQGANPDLLEGYPVHLNVTTQGAFLELLRRGTVGLRALDVVTGRENLDGLDVERVGPAP